MPNCCQWPSRSILWFVYIPVVCWEHSTTVCVLMAVIACLQLATHPHPHSPALCPPTPYKRHPWYYRSCKKLSQKPALNTTRQSQLWNSSYKSALLIQQILRGYNAAQESHSCFNVSKWYFSKYKMWHDGQFSQIQSHINIFSYYPHFHICSHK